MPQFFYEYIPEEIAMYEISGNQIINLAQVIYAKRYEDRISIWFSGIREEFTFYDAEITREGIVALWQKLRTYQKQRPGG